MNTKAGLGVSPIISVSFSVSSIWSHNFGNITLVLYTCFILVEVVLHSMLLRRGKLPGGMGRTILLLDALQFPLSLVFTRFLNWFSVWLPDLPTDCLGTFWGTFAWASGLLGLCHCVHWHRRGPLPQHASDPQPRRRHCPGHL